MVDWFLWEVTGDEPDTNKHASQLTMRTNHQLGELLRSEYIS